MIVIGNVPEINEVKERLDFFVLTGLIDKWELLHEPLLTRRTAAVFFLSFSDEAKADVVWTELSSFPMLSYSRNDDRELSALDWRVEFSKGLPL
jgi:hypothetical protein